MVSERIKMLCKKHGISPNKLGKLSGLDPSTITSIFYNKSKNPGIDTIAKIAKGFGITVLEFFNYSPFYKIQKQEASSE